MSFPVQNRKCPRRLPVGDVFLKQWRIIVSTLHSRKMRVMFSQRASMLIVLGSHIDKGSCVFAEKLTLHDALTHMYRQHFTDKQIRGFIKGDPVDDFVFYVADRFADKRH